MGFKERLKLLRKENNLSQAALAKHLGKSESAIRMWETDRAEPDIGMLIRIGQLFNCTIDYLMGVSEYKNVVEYQQEFEAKNIFIDSFDKLNFSDKDILLRFLDNLIRFRQASFKDRKSKEFMDGVFGKIFNHDFPIYMFSLLNILAHVEDTDPAFSDDDGKVFFQWQHRDLMECNKKLIRFFERWTDDAEELLDEQGITQFIPTPDQVEFINAVTRHNENT
jgi:transcriptional regulator with XRE-family HTH domain